MDSSVEKVAVIGIGNLLLQDEGLGVHAVRELERTAAREGVMFIDAGTDPWSGFAVAQDCPALVLLDAVVGGKAPGGMYNMSLEELESGNAALSLHGVSLLHMVQCETILGNEFRQVRVLGMEPDRVEPGIGLSDRCSARLPEFLEMSVSEIDNVRRSLEAC